MEDRYPFGKSGPGLSSIRSLETPIRFEWMSIGEDISVIAMDKHSFSIGDYCSAPKAVRHPVVIGPEQPQTLSAVVL
jgi:hypothetical protein